MLQTPQADIPDAESSIQGAMHTELQVIKAERDRLRCELVDIRAELTDHRELQSELAQTRARIVSQDREIARLSTTLDRARARARTNNWRRIDILLGHAEEWPKSNNPLSRSKTRHRSRHTPFRKTRM
ncbi:hypothetical protein CDL15_Pgr013839 [Punica granatum]|uniref:Uncharacterized protein n=1 Tax=Punica granatum TaxID=22663 RepID=A0A218VXF5_PUNGR|nr:hypothetical protein CDL15_Pgr013839 [Punica granatum]